MSMADRFDVIVVGGGIHGVGVAQAAAAEGRSVLLVEKSELAAGTSSRSSKLIHGGLRYLEHYEFRLVAECLRERRILLNIAPDLVRLEQFYMPIYRGARRGPLLLTAGLSLYAVLARFGPGAAFSRLSREEAARFADLRQEGLETIFRFSDARTDDRLLTMAVMSSARELGARLWMPARCVGVRLTDDGVLARIRHGDVDREVRGRVVINATGPWVGEFLRLVDPALTAPRFDLVQGSHVVLRDFHVPGCLYMENPRDGRGIFALPWQDGTLVGTTETRFSGRPEDVRPRVTEIRYLLKVMRHFFPAAGDALQRDYHAFAGLRVLPSGEGHAFKRSRETSLLTDRRPRPRLLSIAGGKLTAYRATAARVMRAIRGSLPERRPVADTRALPLAPVTDVAGDD
jgi:glycerol-3-phosphate dehydrogenase